MHSILLAPLMGMALSLPPLADIDAIKAGQEGSCDTVFEGDTIEPFAFKVKGVMKNFLGPGKDIVLVRLLGEKPEFTGVVAGMSGSPCSIDGKLVGALAYAFANFAKEPIAGIAPMKDMLEVLEQPKQPRPWRAGVAALQPQLADDAEGWKQFADGKAPLRRRSEEVVPISAPLTLGGMLPRIRQHFSPFLESQGFVPVAGGTGGGTKKGPKALRPGSPIAAVMVKGDVDIAATGTVTSVDGNKVLAFGHPFFGVGAVSIPMAHATILNTMASMQRSYKMAATGPVIGELTQDRLTAIGGYLGAAPPMIPVKGSLKTPGGMSHFSFDVARDLELSPRFVAMGLANAFSGAVISDQRGTIRVKGKVAAKGFEPMTIQTVYAGERDSNLMIYGAVDVARTVATMWLTPFGPPPMMSVEIEAELEPEPKIEWIDSIFLDRPQARPGDTVEVAVKLGAEDKEKRVERFLLQIPRSWAGRYVDILALGPDLADRVSEELAGDPRPKDLEGVRDWLAGRRAHGNFYLMALRNGAGLRAGVKSMPFLPPSAVAHSSGAPGLQRRSRSLAWEERRESPAMVMGGIRTTLYVTDY